jgi:hypothetical protein
VPLVAMQHSAALMVNGNAMTRDQVPHLGDYTGTDSCRQDNDAISSVDGGRRVNLIEPGATTFTNERQAPMAPRTQLGQTLTTNPIEDGRALMARRRVGSVASSHATGVGRCHCRLPMY